MPTKSSNFVKVTYFDRRAVEQALATFVAHLFQTHAEVEEVIAFGSAIRGDAVPGSDLDLLLVLTRCDRPFLERVAGYLPDRFPVSVDLFPYTRQEMNQLLAEGNRFLAQALREGRSFRR